MITGASGASKSRCSEQPSIWSKCTDEGPSLRMCGGHIIPAKPGFTAANATSSGPSRDTLHPNAAARANQQHRNPTQQFRGSRWQIFPTSEQSFSSPVPQFPNHRRPPCNPRLFQKGVFLWAWHGFIIHSFNNKLASPCCIPYLFNAWLTA